MRCCPSHYGPSGLREPLPWRECEDRVLVADLDYTFVVLELRKLAADVAVAQLPQLVLVQLVDKPAGDLRRRVFGWADAVLPQLCEHVVPIPERRAISRQPLP